MPYIIRCIDVLKNLNLYKTYNYKLMLNSLININ